MAPDGNDAAAIASSGVSAFATVQAAIDFADTHRNLATTVCVAAGAACASTFSYPGPAGELTMRDAIDVLGRYESTGWTRCQNSVTRLLPTTARGIVFGPGMPSTTLLDGFEVHMASTPTTAGITVDGASDAHIVDVSIQAIVGSLATTRYGLNVVNGGGATFDAGRVTLVEEPSNLGDLMIGIRATNSNLDVSDSVIVGKVIGGPVRGLHIENSPGSYVLDTSISITKQGSDADDYPGEGAYVIGAADDVALTNVTADVSAGDSSLGLFVSATGAVRVTDGTYTARGVSGAISGITAVGGGVTIDSVAVVAGASSGNPSVTGIDCDTDCIIRASSVRTENLSLTVGQTHVTRGILCSTCSEISKTGVSVVPGTSIVNVRTMTYDAMGIDLSAGGVLLDASSVNAGCGDVAVGVRASAGNRLQNNVIVGRACNAATDLPTSSFALRVTGTADVHSNKIDGGAGDAACSAGAGVRVGSSGAVLRNNIILPGSCGGAVGVLEASASADPAVLENNDLFPPLYLDENASQLSTVSAINALTGAAANFGLNPLFTDGVHLGAGSPCINAGTATGAPAQDRDGDTRVAPPDVGADEYTADPCTGVDCGNGQCSAGACDCDTGWEDPPGPPLLCEDIDECADGQNGGCDPLTTCTNIDGGRTCGACPPGYAGTGESGCTPSSACTPNPCENGGICYEIASAAVCDCADGIGGATCDLPFEKLAASLGAACGLRADGSMKCWGQNDHREAEPPSGTFTEVGMGEWYGCALRSNGTLACWGDNASGRATPPSGTFEHLAVGPMTSCGIRTDQSLACWGAGDLGLTTPPSGAFTHVSLWSHGCAVKTDQSLACWGWNDYGQATPPPGTFTRVAASGKATCALKTDGTVTCFGGNEYGELGAPSGTFVDVLASGNQHCAVRTNGTVECWGETANGVPPTGVAFATYTMGLYGGGCGVLPSGATECHSNSLKIVHPPGGAFKELGGSSRIHLDGTLVSDNAATTTGAFTMVSPILCGVREDGTLWCLPGFYGEENVPSGTFTSVARSGAHACAVRTNGAIACWGLNVLGQLSPPAGTYLDVIAANGYGCALKTDNTLACWGSNLAGQATPPSGTFTAIAGFYAHACALRTNGTVACWGENGKAQSTPLSGTFTAIAAGWEHTCGIRPNGTVECWGDNTYRQGTAPGGRFTDLTAGSFHTCGLRPDSSVECWGSFVR